MSWKFVMRECGNEIGECALMALKAGYDFFLWNGNVYFRGLDNFYKTALTVNDLF